MTPRKPIHRWRYGYLPRRQRPRRRRWWLALPPLLVIGIALLAFRLAGDDGRPSASPSTSLSMIDTASAPPVTYQDVPTFVSQAPPPEITGRAAAVIEEPCGAFLWGYNARERLAPASLTKIGTALVAAERGDPSLMVNVQVDGAELAATTDSTVMGLQPGQRLSMRDLLYGLLLPSGNDAAIAIAEYVAGSTPAFVDLMNQKVEQLGLRDTHFTNPHGLDDPGLYTSAFDIAVLGRELLRQPELATIVRTRIYQPAWSDPPLWNDNLLLYSYPGSLGVKIGYTDEAQQTIVAAAERQGRRLLASVLRSSDMYRDATALLDWAFTNTPSLCSQRTEAPAATGEPGS